MIKSREVLNIDNFNPLDVDITFIKDISTQLPDEGYMDPAMAERLATSTLKAAELCDDLLGQSVLLLSHCDALKRSAKSKVIGELLAVKTPSTVVKELYADKPEYIEATNEYNKALAWNTWLSNKHSTLIKTHHWCKDFVRKTEGTFGGAAWEPAENVATNLEKPTKNNSKSSWNV